MCDIRETFRKRIRNSAEYKKLEEKKCKLYMSFRFAEAASVVKMMKDVEDKAVESMVKEYEGEFRKVSELVRAMNDDDRERMNIYGNMLVMICDILETTNIEMNQLLKKYHPTYNIETFNKVTALGKEAHERVKMLVAYQYDSWYTNTYGNTADSLYEMTYNKVKSFIGKIKKREETAKKKAKKE